MAHKFTFQTTSDDRRRSLPRKIIIGLGPDESERQVALKILGWALFFRERLQIDTNVPDDAVPFTPGLVELGYDLRPKLWIECSEGGPARLHKIAVKCPGTELWILQRSPTEAEALRHAMKRAELRRDRWNLLAFDPAVFDEVCGLIRERNTFHWFRGDFDPPAMQFELNGLWFDTTFEVSKY